jgi:diguanylate cyclase (GGDEF)-like protein/PAS domain S-box-containing protein
MIVERSGHAMLAMETAINALSHPIVIADYTSPGCPIVFVNEAFTTLTGFGPNEVLGRNCSFLQGPGTDPNVISVMREAIANGLPVHTEVLNYRRDGSTFWNDLTIDPVRNEEGRITHLIAFQNDASLRSAAKEHRQEAEQHFAAIVGNIPGFVFRLVQHEDGTIALPFISASLGRTLGLGEADIVDMQTVAAFLHPLDREQCRVAILQSATALSPLNIDLRFVAKDSTEHWFRIHSTPRLHPGGDVIWDGLAMDIDAERSADVHTASLAGYDGLTGLCNRVQLHAAVRTALEGPPEMRGAKRGQLAMVYIGLDDFRPVNDALGQAFGDGILRRLGLRLREYAERLGGTAARLGGDEFGILLPQIDAAARLQEIGDAVARTVSYPMLVDGQECAVQACIGIATTRGEGDLAAVPAAERPAELLKRAHLALYIAKQDGAGLCRIYSPEFDDRVRNRVTLRQSLQRAISQSQFQLHYQPVVDLDSGRIVGAEALVRWLHPELGVQRPDVFIPFAESSGLIVPLGQWVMKQAMQQVRAWASQGLQAPRIAINLSSVQLSRPGFIAAVKQALHETGADPRQLEFELTEGVFLEGSNETFQQLNALRAMGFELALDDFGTGHSTFKYLRDFPVQKIKIDQTFVRQLVIDSSDASIVRAIIAVSRSLGLSVVAEGIETALQRDFLRDEGCKIGQGYLYSMPLVAEDFGWLLQSGMALPLGQRARMAQLDGAAA